MTRHRLTDEQWALIDFFRPRPRRCGLPATGGRPSMAFYGSCERDHLGAICRKRLGLGPRSEICSTHGIMTACWTKCCGVCRSISVRDQGFNCVTDTSIPETVMRHIGRLRDLYRASGFSEFAKRVSVLAVLCPNLRLNDLLRIEFRRRAK